ncbi:large subunit GTPase 1-like protein [Camelus ferus]|nr:large subunit GTPase 1-like protein [Camelus ferus]
MGRRRAPEARSLGRALIRQQVQRSRSHRHTDSWLHTSELNDGYDWGRLNLQSVTEQSSLDDFLATAELAGTEFVAVIGVSHLLFSDIVVQIVDARNPLLFRCEDLECYVKTMDEDKENVILINKADLLTAEQRGTWATFFEKENVKVIFWSALAEAIHLIGDTKDEVNGDTGEAITAESENSSCDEAEIPHDETEHLQGRGSVSLSEVASSDEEDSVYEDCREEEEDWQTCSEEGSNPDEEACGQNWNESWTVDSEAQGRKTLQKRQIHNFSHLVSKRELLEIFKQLHSGKKVKEGQLTVGLVGYPNVGKSSTINTIMGNKKVSVSATPGHTKHFQTLYVEPGLCLCDCPGLVMPSFVSTKAEMICSGILPIDQMRDHVPPVSLISLVLC